MFRSVAAHWAFAGIVLVVLAVPVGILLHQKFGVDQRAVRGSHYEPVVVVDPPPPSGDRPEDWLPEPKVKYKPGSPEAIGELKKMLDAAARGTV